MKKERFIGAIKKGVAFLGICALSSVFLLVLPSNAFGDAPNSTKGKDNVQALVAGMVGLRLTPSQFTGDAAELSSVGDTRSLTAYAVFSRTSGAQEVDITAYTEFYSDIPEDKVEANAVTFSNAPKHIITGSYTYPGTERVYEDSVVFDVNVDGVPVPEESEVIPPESEEAEVIPPGSEESESSSDGVAGKTPGDSTSSTPLTADNAGVSVADLNLNGSGGNSSAGGASLAGLFSSPASTGAIVTYVLLAAILLGAGSVVITTIRRRKSDSDETVTPVSSSVSAVEKDSNQ